MASPPFTISSRSSAPTSTSTSPTATGRCWETSSFDACFLLLLSMAAPVPDNPSLHRLGGAASSNFNHAGDTPTSSSWRGFLASSAGYGLTKGTKNAGKIELTDLGRKLVAPKSDGEDAIAIGEAVLQPTIM